MTNATAVEFQREFGKFRAIAQREPVMVTNHGRADLVVLSVQEYKRLKARDRQAIRVADMSDADLALFEMVEIPEEASAFDHERE